MSWVIEETGFDRENVELNGNKFLQGNGYMGYRGTLEEFSREQLAACILGGIYDKVGDAWREPISAPNGLFTRLTCDGEPLSVLSGDVEEHTQSLDIRSAIHRRRTVFDAPSGNSVLVQAERFVALDDVHLLALKYSFRPSKDCRIVIETGIDGDVWDLNGPHLENLEAEPEGDLITLNATTHELGLVVSVAEALDKDFGAAQEIVATSKSIIRKITVEARANVEYTLHKYVSIFSGADAVPDPSASTIASAAAAAAHGFDGLLVEHRALWDARWQVSDVQVRGDEEAQLALRYSIYHLLIIAPTHSDKVSIPARGLSAQAYKGAIFWDTEIFMLPFFLYTNPSIARNLIRYRINTLDGARRKAAEYGFRGAYYAWESQETGDDACTHFAFNDVFTGRPMRTYFRDKQVHISADVVYALWQYYRQTGDESVLVDGGAEVILECARFFFSYSYFKKEKNRYEILDVTGPDEYHERINNNIYTSMMVRNTLEIALETVDLLEAKYPDAYADLISRLSYDDDLKNIREMNELLYVPAPDPATRVIEQFDRYHTLEDPTVEELKTRIIDPNEYLGGGNGIASNTKIIKQADTVLMLNLFRDRYSPEVKKANWDYYEPRTDHGSSLSACVYALVACDMGDPEWGYKFFLKTATIDLTGEAKQTVGGIYIGGTHPAANGGAWMVAVLGFGGAYYDGEAIAIRPQLPASWEGLAFTVTVEGQVFKVSMDRATVSVHASEANTQGYVFKIASFTGECKPGQDVVAAYA